MDKYSNFARHLDSFVLVRLLQFVQPGKPSQAESRHFLQELCAALAPQLPTMRLKDLEILAFGLYFLNNKEICRDMSPRIAAAVEQCNWTDVRSGKSFVYLVMYLAKMGEFNTDYINRIMSRANKCTMEKLHTFHGLSTAIQFLFDLNIAYVKNENTNNIIMKDRYHMRNSLFCLVQLDAMRELYNLDCVELKPSLRKKLTDFFHAQPEFEFETQSPEGNIEADTFNARTKGFVHRDLINILGGSEYVWTGHPFPHSTSSVFILKRDIRGKFLPIPEDFVTFYPNEIVSRNCGNDVMEDYIAVLVPNKGQQTYHGHILGPLETNIEHLQMLGYKPVVVFWVEYFRQLKAKKNLGYLRKLLKDGYFKSKRGETDE